VHVYLIDNMRKLWLVVLKHVLIRRLRRHQCMQNSRLLCEYECECVCECKFECKCECKCRYEWKWKCQCERECECECDLECECECERERACEYDCECEYERECDVGVSVCALAHAEFPPVNLQQKELTQKLQVDQKCNNSSSTCTTPLS